MNAVIACGGTGGHLFPGIAVAEVLRDRGHEVMLLVSEKDIDAFAKAWPFAGRSIERLSRRWC
jgi:UDP-N-acetylglucosamine--N-acetylmuramyl-(pentapeptide) pyrophosphoryl-undecaprenol N-acetylglucosamine transferase